MSVATSGGAVRVVPDIAALIPATLASLLTVDDDRMFEGVGGVSPLSVDTIATVTLISSVEIHP
jgi:hypothetical protein